MPKKYVTIVEDYNVPLTPWYILVEKVFREMTEDKAGIDSIIIHKKDFVTWSPSLEDFNRAGDYFNKKIVQDESFAKFLHGKEVYYFKEIEKLIDYLSKTDLKKKTSRQLYEIYLKYYNAIAQCWRFGMAIQFLDMGENKYSERIKSGLLPKLKKIGNPEIVFSKLITPRQENAIQAENNEFLKFLAAIQKNKKQAGQIKKDVRFSDLDKDLIKKIKMIAKKYGWIQFYYIGPSADAGYYYDLLKLKINLNAKKVLDKIKKERKEILDFQNKYEKFFDSGELKQIKTLRDFMYLKEARKEFQIYRLSPAMHRWFSEVGRRFSWSPLQCRYIIKKEYENLLVKNKKILNADILNERYKKCAFYSINGKIRLVTGKKADEIEKKYIVKIKVNANIKELKGTVAYPGKARGAVKIVNSTSDLSKFNQGDILVSYSTNPSLVPAMNKASAIITNTGGVTCHAAIISRELKIPCVIGTNVATKVLKDGDLVEVDANKGIVRKI